MSAFAGKIDRISLDNVLPSVFVGDEDYGQRSSDVWLKETVFERREFYCINAVSGAGKTSLCSFIYGSRHDYTGRILFNGFDIREFGIKDWCKIRRRHLAFLPQDLELFPELTAFDNVMLKNRLTDFLSDSEIKRMFEFLEVDNRINVPAGRLSAGQRQRVALIRALCQPFDFILLDEPVSHLDEINNRKCAEMVSRVAEALEAGVISTSVGNSLAVAGNVEILNL